MSRSDRGEQQRLLGDDSDRLAQLRRVEVVERRCRRATASPESASMSPDAMPASVVLPRAGRAADHDELARAHLRRRGRGGSAGRRSVTSTPRSSSPVDGQRDHAPVGDGPGAEREHLGDAVLRAAEVLPRARELVERAGELAEAGADLEREAGTCRRSGCPVLMQVRADARAGRPARAAGIIFM